MAPMRIALLATSTGMGGAETQVLAIAREMRSRGHESLILSLVPHGPVGAEAERLGVPTLSLDMRPGFPDPRALLRLAKVLRRWRPDILHSHMVHANLLARLARPLAPVPVLISTAHNINEGGAVRMAAYRLTNRLADLNTIISRAAAERYTRIGAVARGGIRVIPNGVDTQRFRPRPEGRAQLRQALGLGERFVWLAVGRFEAAKDYPNLLAAFGKLRSAYPGAELLLVGRGTLQNQMETLAKASGLADAVRFLGLRLDVPELMSAADAYVMSSAWEGLPMVLLEAASSGLPIVATDVGGNCEVLVGDASGYLTRAGDSGALAGAMGRVMGLAPDALAAMGAQGRAHVCEQYSLPRIVETWEATYRELLSGRGKSACASAGQR